MKPGIALIMLAAIGLAGCTEYKPSSANCFNKVSRSSTSMAFLEPSQDARRVSISTKSQPCAFTALQAPQGGAK